MNETTVKKIVIIGPESTGKSTLSSALAAAYDTIWIPEYARDYLLRPDRNDGSYEEADLLHIAQGQLRTEDLGAQQAKEKLFCDTDLYVLKVWWEAKYGHCHRFVLEEIARRKYDLYLLTYIDVAWEDDPLREHAAETERHYFYHQYRDIVMNSGVPWADIRGNEQERLAAAINAIEQL